MPAKLNVFNLGANGVNVDLNPLQLTDGELTKSQNAIQVDGGLRKRRGLLKINSVAAAGAINGAIAVQLGVGSAGNESPTLTPDSGAFNVLMGRYITSATSGWQTTTTAFTPVVTTGGPDGYDATATPVNPEILRDAMFNGEVGGVKGLFSIYPGHASVVYKGRLFYAGNDYVLGTTAPTLRMWDGSTDYLLLRLPPRNGVVRQGIVAMLIGGDNLIYLITYDAGSTATSNLTTTVFQLDPENRVLSQIGDVFPQGAVQNVPVTALGWGQNRLWARTTTMQAGDVHYYTYFFRPGVDTAWTLDETVNESRGGLDVITYQGRIFFSMQENPASVVGAVVRVRSTLGVYSTAKTALALESAGPDMASFGSNHFGKMITFGGNLYVSYWNNNGNRFSRIYKFDGTTWTVVYASTSNGSTAVPFTQAMVIGGKLHFFSSWNSSSGLIHVVIQSPDGTTWTDQSALLSNLIPVVGSINL